MVLALRKLKRELHGGINLLPAPFFSTGNVLQFQPVLLCDSILWPIKTGRVNRGRIGLARRKVDLKVVRSSQIKHCRFLYATIGTRPFLDQCYQ